MTPDLHTSFPLAGAFRSARSPSFSSPTKRIVWETLQQHRPAPRASTPADSSVVEPDARGHPLHSWPLHSCWQLEQRRAIRNTTLSAGIGSSPCSIALWQRVGIEVSSPARGSSTPCHASSRLAYGASALIVRSYVPDLARKRLSLPCSRLQKVRVRRHWPCPRLTHVQALCRASSPDHTSEATSESRPVMSVRCHGYLCKRCLT